MEIHMVTENVIKELQAEQKRIEAALFALVGPVASVKSTTTKSSKSNIPKRKYTKRAIKATDGRHKKRDVSQAVEARFRRLKKHDGRRSRK